MGPGLWLLDKAPRSSLCGLPCVRFLLLQWLVLEPSEDLNEALKLHLELSCCVFPHILLGQSMFIGSSVSRGRHVSPGSW